MANQCANCGRLGYVISEQRVYCLAWRQERAVPSEPCRFRVKIEGHPWKDLLEKLTRKAELELRQREALTTVEQEKVVWNLVALALRRRRLPAAHRLVQLYTELVLEQLNGTIGEDTVGSAKTDGGFSSFAAGAVESRPGEGEQG